MPLWPFNVVITTLIIYKNTMFFGKCIVMIFFFDKFAAGLKNTTVCYIVY